MMEYQKKQERQKILVALPIIAAIIIIVVVLCILVAPSLISTPATPTPFNTATLTPIDGDPQFNDIVLENAIKKQLGIEHSPTKEEIESLTVLDYTEETVTDLTGLEFAINLKELRLKIELITIEPISKLQISKLTFLSDVSVQPLVEEISKISYINYLDLSDCGISIIGYLSELPNLETLILDNNRISDLKYIPSIKTLSTLSVKNCNLKSIRELADSKMLRNLYVDNNRIEDITVKHYLPSLVEFTYEGNPIKDDK